MTKTDKSNGSPRKSHKHDSPASPSEQDIAPDRLAFTMDTKTGEIVQVERVDTTGARHELTKDDRASLAKNNGRDTLEELLEQAFEAGIACLLGGEDEPDEPKEAKEDAELRHILLKPLIDESPAARLMRRDVLNRAIVETLIHHSLKSRSGGSKWGSPKQPDPDHAAP
jgi:hypothetical protein